ncbi:MAG: hypothetical protein R3310_02995 [Candidatus Competibacteraceae bacterium]|nr:hypothetical protein [Candidatus Competibacteraceae bacterium]
MKKTPTPLEHLRTEAALLAQQGVRIEPISREIVGERLGLTKVQVGRFERGTNELRAGGRFGK